MNPDSLDHTLQRARGALTPASRDRARVLERLGARFPELSSGVSNPAHSSFLQTLRATGAGGASLGAGLLAAGFIAGYALKAELGAGGEVAEMHAAAPAAAIVAPPAPHAERAMAQPPRGGAEPPPSQSEPSAGVDVAPPEPHAPRARSATHAAADTEQVDRREQLEDELRTLQRAERALRNDNPELALALLAELDARYPRALLGEERAATRIMAACRAGRASAADTARGFLDAHPRSVYGDRIRASCRLETGAEKTTGAKTDGAAADIDGR